jgi:hypothetical protein
MTHDEAAKVIARMTYRPGWKFEWYVADPRAFDIDRVSVFRVGTREPDSESKAGELVDVMYAHTFSFRDLSAMDEQWFLREVRAVIEKRVLHELDEWLRIDGKPLVEPHPEKGWRRGALR